MTRRPFCVASSSSSPPPPPPPPPTPPPPPAAVVGVGVARGGGTAGGDVACAAPLLRLDSVEANQSVERPTTTPHRKDDASNDIVLSHERVRVAQRQDTRALDRCAGERAVVVGARGVWLVRASDGGATHAAVVLDEVHSVETDTLPFGFVYQPLVDEFRGDVALRRAPISCVHCDAIANRFCTIAGGASGRRCPVRVCDAPIACAPRAQAAWTCAICAGRNELAELASPGGGVELFPELTRDYCEFVDPSRQPPAIAARATSIGDGRFAFAGDAIRACRPTRRPSRSATVDLSRRRNI